MTPPSNPPPPAYWALVAALFVFGVVTIFTIGLPLLVLALVLTLLSPVYARPRAFWPPLVGVAAFFAGATLVVPLQCRSGASAVSAPDGTTVLERDGGTTCNTVVGFDYAGSAGYEPPYAPALGLGAATGITAALVTRRKLGAQRSPM